MRTGKLLRGLSILGLLFCAAPDFGQTPSPVPLITQVSPPSLSPANLTPGSNNFTLTILGANFGPNESVGLSSAFGSAWVFNPPVNATGTQMVASFTNVSFPVVGTVTVTVVKTQVTGGILVESNAYYLPVTPPTQTAVFNTAVTSFLQGSPSGMVAADFNRDDQPDLAVLSQVSNTVSILTQNFGVGTFTTGATYATGNQPRGIVAADFNRDQIPDLAITNASDNTVTILLANGDGTFRPGTTIGDPGVFPTQIVAADFNGDGKMDLAVLNVCGTGQNGCYPVAAPMGPGNVAILLGNGDGTFTVAPTLPATGLAPTAMAAADLNADGFIDLIVANSSNNLTLLMGNGDGTFSAAANTPATGFAGPPSGIGVGDFNGDGALDVAVTSSGDNAVSILLNQNCAGLPAPQCTLTPTSTPVFVGTGPSAIATADMNADGILDLVVTNSGDGTVSLLLGDGTGGFTATGPLPAKSFPTGSSPQALALFDFNLDGRLDVVTVNGSGSYSLLPQMSVPQVTLTTSNGLPFYGLFLTLTATVIPPYGQPTPTGTVTFYDGNTSLGSAALSGYQAIFQFATLNTGNHQITAVYNGDGNLVPSTSNSVTEIVTQAQTTVTLGSSVNTVPYGQPFTLTATIQPQNTGIPTGTVNFFEIYTSTSLGSATLVNGVAQLTLSNLAPGAHVITAGYQGDLNFTGSVSPTYQENITQATTSIVVATSASPVNLGQTPTLTATIQPSASTPATGLVAFYDNGSTPLGTAPITNNTAQLQTRVLSVGPHSITAQYSGDTNYSGSTASAIVETVNPAADNVSVSTSSTFYGQPSTFIATVQPVGYSGTPTGTLTFSDGTTVLGTGTLSNGSAQFTTSTLTVGSHSISASYSGDANFQPATSAQVTANVSKVNATTTITSGQNPSTFGQTVQLTAVVQPVYGGTATGSVTFLDGSVALGTITLTGNAATLSVSSLTAGTHFISAAYAGDSNVGSSTSTSISQTVNPLSTTTTLASSLNPATAGQAVTLTASIQAGAGNLATGTVTFMDGSAALGTATVTNNSAQLTVSTLAAGSHSITAAYSGSTNFSGSTSAALTETINQSSTATTLVSNSNPATFGQAVPFVATVQTASGGAATGTVTFFDGATTLGTASVSTNGGHNVAQFTFSGLLGGTHTITAAYSGDTNYAASTSGALTQTINPASSTLTVGASSNPASFGQAVILTATVVPSVNGTLATGTVTFFDGANSLGTANLANNVAQISVTNLALGSHSITATYAGDRNLAGSTSAALAEVVNPTATSTVVTSSANPALVNTTVTFTAAVSSSIAGTQSGTVSFYLDGSGTAAASVNLSNGTAKYSTNSLSAGSHSVVAVFTSSNPNFAGNTSSAFTQFVSDFTVAVSPSSLTVARNTSGTYTVTVTPVGGFSGTVSLSCGGVPGGTTCAISPTQLTLSGSGSTQATVTITAAQNASKGNHTLTFTGTSGGLNHKITANLTIN
ncbi:MAG TPA: Ig-like domain repeat protein [Candidatus Acidoferrum sp.]|nr:Ig-like domain repeat protein [Candidatus Acidoferrum sp.]